MKPKSIAAMLAMAGMLLIPAVAGAQVPVVYSTGDLLMGFRAASGTGSTKNYVVNIGQPSLYTGATSSFVVPGSTGIPADLTATFGETWSNRSDVFWSISGSPGNLSTNGADVAKTLYATKAQATPGILNPVPWLRKSSTAQGAAATKMSSFGNAYAKNALGVVNMSTANNPVGIIQSTSGVNYYSSYQPGGTAANSGATGPGTGISYAFFNPSVEADFSSGMAGAVLELYRIVPATGSAVDMPAQLVGYFRMAGTTLEFTPAAEIAESTVSFNNTTYSAKETDGVATITLQRNGGLANPFTVTLTTANGTGVAGTNYTSTTQVVSFAANQSVATVTVPVTNIPGLQGDKTFTVSLSGGTNSASVTSPSFATVTIKDAVDTFALSAPTYSVAESGTQVSVVVNRTGDTSAASTVTFTTSSGPANGVLTKAAVAGTDFTDATQTLSFAAGETSKTVDIAVANRSGAQGNRDFTVTLSGTGATTGLGTSSAVVTITEGVGTISFSSATMTTPPTEVNVLGVVVPRTVLITLIRNGAAGGPTSVTVSKATGGDLAAAEFEAFTPTVVNFLNGETSKSVSLQLKAIAKTLTRTANFTVSGAAASGVTSTALTIQKADTAKPVIVVTSPTVTTTTSTSVSVTGTIKEDNSGASLSLSVNGVDQPLSVGGFTPNVAVAFSSSSPVALDNGLNVLVFTAVDATGNKTVVTKKVTVSNTALYTSLAGTYAGLFSASGTVSNDNTGYLSLAVTASGLFTGKATLSGEDISISGVFGNDGVAHFKPSLSTSVNLVTLVGSPVYLGSLNLTLSGAGALSGSVATKAVGGSVLATLSAGKAGYSATSTVPSNLLNLTGKGVYSVALPARVKAGSFLSTYPQGDGVATLTVLANGAVSVAGSLADGTPLTAAGILRADNSVALFSKLYGAQGSLSGLATLDVSASNSDVAASTPFVWIKPARARAQYYPAGWTSGIKVDFIGSKFTKPASLNFGQGTSDLVLGNASLVFSEGLLTSARTSPVNIDPATGKLTVIASLTQPYTAGQFGTTGIVAGTFTHSDSTKPAFKAVLLNKGANQAGFGYFLSTPAASVGGGAESGAVNLNP